MFRPNQPRRVVLAGVVALAVGGAPPERASAQDVSGTWDVTWAQAVRINRDGSMEIQKWGPATLVLRQTDEVVTGTWTERVVGVVRWKVDGTFRDGHLALTAQENDSDDPELAVVSRMRWRAIVDADHMEGKMTLEFRGSDRARPWRPWRGEREKAG